MKAKYRKEYEEHLAKWNRARKSVSEHNQKLIDEWRSIPWWKFWVSKPSFEEQRQIIVENWAKFNNLPVPLLKDYFPFS